MIRTPRTYAGIALGLGTAALAALAIYPHLAARTPASPAPATPPSTTAPQTFQAYTFLHGLPLRPAKRTNRHGKLRLTRIKGQYYLAGADHHFYRAGRDRQGHLIPVYYDPQTGKDYPLYYDRDRDRYYRITEDSQSHTFYRNYEGDPQDRLYEDDADQRAGQEYAQESGDSADVAGSDNYAPAPDDEPDIVAADSADNSEDGFLDLPVIAGACLLLRPRTVQPPHFVPPSGVVIAMGSSRTQGTRPGPRLHYSNPPIFVRPPIPPTPGGKPSTISPNVLTHRWAPPGAGTGSTPPTVVAQSRIAPPAHPPRFQRPTAPESTPRTASPVAHESTPV
ncbi:MAG TPA: hypothetical protein VKT32_15490, partial [Chthonomonadaceae bacterium]|nr:hypothetical protein [Chthonomonadaceae bacterium]